MTAFVPRCHVAVAAHKRCGRKATHAYGRKHQVTFQYCCAKHARSYRRRRGFVVFKI